MGQTIFPGILISELDHETHYVPMLGISYTVHTVCISDQSFMVASSVHISCTIQLLWIETSINFSISCHIFINSTTTYSVLYILYTNVVT